MATRQLSCDIALANFRDDAVQTRYLHGDAVDQLFARVTGVPRGRFVEGGPFLTHHPSEARCNVRAETLRVCDYCAPKAQKIRSRKQERIRGIHL